MQFAHVSSLIKNAFHVGHKSPQTSSATQNNATAMDTRERPRPVGIVEPDRPNSAAAVPTPIRGGKDAVKRFDAARTLVEHMAPGVLDNDAAGLIFAIALHDEPGCTASELSAEMLKALRESGELNALALVRAETMTLKTLRQRVALIGTPIDKAEAHFSRVFVEGIVKYSSQHAAFQGDAVGNHEEPTPAVAPEKLANVTEIHRLMPTTDTQVRADMLIFALGYVAASLNDDEVQTLLTYWKSDAGKRAAKEWTAGESRAQDVMRGSKVQSAMSVAFRMALPASVRSDSASESESTEL